jgi:RNA polymerase sigma factor (sigma-70 family)
MEPLDEESKANQPTPSEQLESKDESGSIWRAARSLKPNQYEVLWLSYGEGFSISETAKIMNTNQLRVRVMLHRARNLLMKKLSKSGQMLYNE